MKRFNATAFLKFDSTTNGNAFVNGNVTVYLAGTSTTTKVKASLFKDSAGTIAKDNPVKTDSNGMYFFYINPLNVDIVINEGNPGTNTIFDEPMLDDAIVNVKSFGAVGDDVTDDTAAIQAAMDSLGSDGGTVFFPRTPTSYRAKELIIKQSGISLIADGVVTIKYNGVGSDASDVNSGFIIRADKTLDHSGENYQNVLIKGFILDGNDTALYGLKLDGFTRRCEGNRLKITQCVCPLHLTNGFYSVWDDCEFTDNPLTQPSGMNTAAYDAAKFGTFLTVCHIAEFTNCKWYQLGGGSGNSYTAGLFVTASNSISFNNCSFEEMREAEDTRFIDEVISIGTAVTVTISSPYIELVQASSSIIFLQQNASLLLEDPFFNTVKSVDLFEIQPDSPCTIINAYGRDLDLSGKVFNGGATPFFYRLRLLGNTTFAAGVLDGAIYNAGTTTNSKFGLTSDPILLDQRKDYNDWSGHPISDYTPSIDGDFIKVSFGTRMLNGQVVTFGIDNNTGQRLVPDLTIADTWNIRISGCGSMYIEVVGSPSDATASLYSPIIATFTTPGSGGAPASLTLIGTNNDQLDTRVATWIPKIEDGSANVAVSSQQGNYTRIGNLVFCTGEITLSSVGSTSGVLRMTGLPFPVRADGSNVGCINFSQAENLSVTAGTYITGQLVNTTSIALLQQWTLTVGPAGLSSGNITNTSRFRFSFTYLTEDQGV